MRELTFTAGQVLALFGAAQCTYILAYMALRAGKLSRAGIPLAYFSVLALAFSLDALAEAFGAAVPFYALAQWAAWFMGPPLAVLVAVQVAQIDRVPPPRYYAVLAFVPCALAVSLLATYGAEGCTARAAQPCLLLREWLTVSGFVAGCLALLGLWIRRDIFAGLTAQKTGKDRYWLILALAIANIAFLADAILSLGVSGSSGFVEGQSVLVRNVLGLALVYLAATSVLRIYPRAVLLTAPGAKAPGLSPEDEKIAQRIEALLDQDKVYQEASYTRADLARECGVSEAVVSRALNARFGKSFPRLMNERRVRDARRLLDETDAPVNVVASEVGFSSLSSFNRAFRDETGESPSTYRRRNAA